ncbi:RagB/SusD family nutrient uptake outer membrane protein [Albibacterium indicum]|uniref:RagB/SusD family nutrient uptake outer membrane protein n=1 Tax=Albibacterium indicum TaxID=2292082 RepID=UPI000E4C1B4C|nr:RagB/SusD family nutrient uptake outer membrane protein [Pedobacter indicus]
MKTHQYILGASIVALSLGACSESFLDRDPLGSLAEEEYFQTDNAAMKLITDCYGPMLDGWGYTVNKIALGDESVDNADGGGSDPGDRPQTIEVGRGRPLASNALLQEAWSNRFLGIGKANLAIQNIEANWDKLIANGTSVSEETKARYIAEAKFLRAWYYFDLVWVFKEVPLIVEPQDPEARVPKSSTEDLRIQIYKDLDEAIAVASFPRSSEMPREEKGRANKDAAYALKARAALFFAGLMEAGKMNGNADEEYVVAKAAAEQVVLHGNLSLLPDFQDLFRGDYQVGPFSEESILPVIRAYLPEVNFGGDAFAIMNVGRNNVGGWGGNTPTRDLASEYEVEDPRKMFTIISHGDIFKTASGGEEVHNYRGYYNDFNLQHSRKAFVPQQYRVQGNLQRSNWGPYWIRYSEVLLIYAEALLKTNASPTEVVKYINEVRRRAFVTSSKTDEPAIFRKFQEGLKPISESEFTSKFAVKPTDNLMEAIKHERRVELALEGFRLYDLVRWNEYAPVMKAFYTKYGFADKGINAGENSWPFPIPQTEIDRSNGILEQNSNY